MFVLFPTIIGLNGLAFRFCAITGLWDAWAWLWTIEPLLVGLSLLAVSARTKSSSLVIAGLVLCALASTGLILMMTILSGWWLVSLLGSATLILAGVLLLARGTVRYVLLPRLALA